MSGHKINFNQDFTSISVLGSNGYKLFALPSIDKAEEVYAKDNVNIKIIERLFNSSLVVVVTASKPNCLKMLHFKKKQDICNCVYPTDIVCIRMNRTRLIVCLSESIHIHDIRDMKILHSIENIPINILGLCSLSLNSHLAYPISSITGELKIFNANKLKPGLSIKAHETPLSAVNFSPNGLLIATASERGTVIRVFCIKNAQKVHEFRRGVKRCVEIASLVFNSNAEYLCASSNTETVHIFKIDPRVVEQTERRSIIESSDNVVGTLSLEDISSGTGHTESSWSGYLTKAVSSYFPSQMYDVFSQDRAFATAQLTQPGLKHVCCLARIQKEIKLLVGCEDGFLYIYDFSESKGGFCKMIRAHDLRNPLEGVIELNLSDGNSQSSQQISGFSGSRQIIQQVSYAGILKGNQIDKMSESEKLRNLCDAIETPTKIFDDVQFPPVAALRE